MIIAVIVLSLALAVEVVWISLISLGKLQKQIESLQNLLVVQSQINDIFDASNRKNSEDIKDLVTELSVVQEKLEGSMDVHDNFVEFVDENYVRKGPKKVVAKAKKAKRGRPKKS